MAIKIEILNGKKFEGTKWVIKLFNQPCVSIYSLGHVTGGQVEATTCNNKVYVEEGSTALLPCLLDLENLGRRMVRYFF